MILIKKNQLNIGHLSTAYHTNFVMMADEKLKNDLNLGFNWILFGTGPAMVKAFENEVLDIGYMGLPPAIIGIDKGVPIKCVAGGHVEGTIMVAKQETKSLSQLNNNLTKVFKQFKGKVIGVPSRGSIHEVILNHYLKKYNLLEKVKVRHYKQAEFIAIDIKENRLTAGVGTPALAIFASTILKSHLIIPPEKLWANNPSYGIFIRDNFIEDHEELISKFLKRHKEASNLLRNSPSLAARKIASSFRIFNKDYAEAVIKISPKYCAGISKAYLNATMEFVKILFKLGYIKRRFKMKNIFDFRFIKEIHPEKEHYSK